MKRPAFQVYPADWRKDAALQLCSIGARGMWWEMICVMHEAIPYGHFIVAGQAPTDEQASRLLGVVPGQFKKLLAELEIGLVFSRTEAGIIYSRRMVKDERLRETRAAGGALGAEDGKKGAEFGKLGGRPKTSEGGKEPPLPPIIKPPINPPPSSSSSSSSSSKTLEALSGKPDLRQQAKDALERLNRLTGRAFRDVPANLNPIVARLREGYTERDLRLVIATKCNEWSKDEKMAEYLRPKTLFNRTNFASYAGQIPPLQEVSNGN